MAAEGHHLPLSVQMGPEGFKIRVVPDIDLVPVVQAGPLQMFVIDLETQRMNQVKPYFSGPAQPGDVPGIGRYFGLIKNYIEVGILECSVFHPGNITRHRKIIIQSFAGKEVPCSTGSFTR